MSKVLWLPDAIRDDHKQHLAWTETTSPKACLHTTEGSGYPSYAGWTHDPHLTVMPIPGKGIEFKQHVDFGHASFALKHTQAQATNTDYVIQIECIGTSDINLHNQHGWYYWPEADDAVLEDFYNKIVVPLSDPNCMGIPIKSTVTWRNFSTNRGSGNEVRLSNSQYDTYSGWLAHQHVPQNDHTDTDFRIHKLLSFGDNMALTDADVNTILNHRRPISPDEAALWLAAGVDHRTVATGVTINEILTYGGLANAELRKVVAAQGVKIDQILALAQKNSPLK